jgi:hypothetical protein
MPGRAPDRRLGSIEATQLEQSVCERKDLVAHHHTLAPAFGNVLKPIDCPGELPKDRRCLDARPSASRDAACLPQGLRRSRAMHDGEHGGAGSVEVGPPGRVHSQWTRALTCPQPAADRLFAEHQWAACAWLLWRPFSTSQQGSVGDANRRPLDDRAKMKCETGAAWVIAPRGVDQQHVGKLRQRSNGALQQWALTEGKEPGLIGGTDRTCRHDACHDSLIHGKRCSGTAKLTARVGLRRLARKAHETPADGVRARRRVPGWRSRPGELALLAAQLVG